MINILTVAKPTDPAPEQAVNSPNNNSSERPQNTLDLLVPWDIPLECNLSEPVKQQIEDSLRSLLQALTNPDLSKAHTQITHLLTTFPTSNTHPAKIKTTKTALSPAAVEDYDTYFGITHIQTTTEEDTALTLTRGLLTNCHKFITLCRTTPTLDPQHITQQKQGFISYIHLLTRVFNIENLL